MDHEIDSDNNILNETQTTGNTEAEEILINKPKSKHRVMKPLNEEMLTGSEGLIRIYKEFPTLCPISCQNGSEKADLKHLLDSLREWSFQMHPGLSTADVLVKCESLGSSARVRNYLQSMRVEERDRYLDNFHG